MTSPLLELRSDLRFVPQSHFRKWRCVVEDPIQNKFFRLGRNEYLIASLLNGKRSPAEIVEMLRQIPDCKSITPNFVQSTLRWLIGNRLVRAAGEKDSLERSSHAAAPSLFGPVGDPFSFRLPLLSGEWLQAFARQWQWLYTIPMAIVGGLIVIAAAFVFGSNPEPFTSLSATLFVPDSLCWWAAAWLILKSVHELGHAIACVAHGGTLRNAGLAFFYLAPVPYVDTTDMWRLPNRYARMMCAASGVLAEVVVSSLALLVCHWSDHHANLQYLCITMATLGTITTVAFNGNPLTRFDGYYVLADLLDRPCLWNEGQAAARHLLSVVTFGSYPHADGKRWLLAAYGVGCFLYRCMIMVGLAWGAWNGWQGLGLIFAAVAAYLWFLLPFLKKMRRADLRAQMFESLTSISYRRLALVASGLLALTLIVTCAPSPFQPMVPGIVGYIEPQVVRSESEGLVEAIFAEDGKPVAVAEPLLELSNPKLALALSNMQIDLDRAEERSRSLRANQKLAELQAETAKIDALRTQIAQTEKQVKSLTPVAPRKGQFVSRQIHNRRGSFIKAGEVLGTIVDPERFEIDCSISQMDVSTYQSQIGHKVLVRTDGGLALHGRLKEVHPRYSDSLEYPSLAAKYGGPITVRMNNSKNDKGSLKTETPRNAAKVELEEGQVIALRAGEHCTVELAECKETILGMTCRYWRSLLEWVLPEPTKGK